MELRKQKEKKFHNKIRDKGLNKSKFDYEYLTSNKKFYSITRKSRDFVNAWLKQRCQNKVILDYCCGGGEFTVFLAKNGAQKAIGIDISEVSIKNAQKKAVEEKVEKNTKFFIMDAENLDFEDSYFDIIACSGVLHHLDIKKAYPELARVLKPDGKVICDEPLVYNPVFHFYRKMTPHLRTEWELHHILGKKDIEIAKSFFEEIEDIKFFHLATLLAVPFRNLPGFGFILSFLEKVDSVLLKLPLLKWLAWQVVFIFSRPKK